MATISHTVRNPNHSTLTTPGTWAAPVTLLPSHTYLAYGGGLFHLVGRNSSNQLVHRSSKDGTTWSSEHLIVAGEFPAQYGGLEVVGDSVYLITHPSDVGSAIQHADFRKSTDAGVTWGSAVRFTVTSTRTRRTFIAVKGSYVHIAGYQTNTSPTPNKTFYWRSTDGGASFSAATEIQSGGSTVITDIAVGQGDVVHICYPGVDDNPDGSSLVHYKRSTDNGATWSAGVRIGGDPISGNTANSQNRVRIAAADGRVIVCWEGPLNATRPITGVRSLDDGVSWGSRFDLTPSPSVVNNHHNIDLVGNVAHLTYAAGTTASNPPTAYRYSSNYGKTWSDEETAIAAPTQNPFSQAPSPNRVCVVSSAASGGYKYTSRRF